MPRLPWHLGIRPFISAHAPLTPPCSVISSHRSRFTTSGMQNSCMELTQNLFDAMKSCVGPHSSPFARAIHASLVSGGFSSSVFFDNNMLYAYFNCGMCNDARQLFDEITQKNVFTWNIMISGFSNSGFIDDAEMLFDQMPIRDSASWNALMSGYFRNGKPKETIVKFIAMSRQDECEMNVFTLTCAMKAAGALQCAELGEQLHAIVRKSDLERDEQIQGSVINMYLKCEDVCSAAQVFEALESPNLFCWNSMIMGYSELYGVGYALGIFKQMPEHDIVTWNTMISVLSQNGYWHQAQAMAIDMNGQGFMLDSTTYSTVLSACASILDLEWGRHLHARIVRSQQSIDLFIGSALVDMYSKCGDMVYAKRSFYALPDHSAASWTALVSGLSQSGRLMHAIDMFRQMRESFTALDQFTLATVVTACCSQKDLLLGAQLHTHSVKIGHCASLPVSNALVSMYTKCGNVQGAELVFQSMPTRDVISWTSMITAYSQLGNVVLAREYFDKMGMRNVISWNAMLGAYVQHGDTEGGLKLYVRLLREDSVMPDWITISSVLRASADAGALRLGSQIVAHTVKLTLHGNISVANGIIMMYSKCGNILDARKVFDSINEKDLVSWNSMITAYAQNGQGRKAIETFECMILEGIKPDYISYVAVLSGCSHSGLVEEGQSYFNSMTEVYGIVPGLEHYACMVDLLGRAGNLEQAKEMIDSMPVAATAEVWGALLGACKIHGNMEMAECAVKHLSVLDSQDSGSYVLLAKIYSDMGNSEDHARVRKLMREKGIKKNPGHSWIEVENKIHVFTADDANHPQLLDIQETLDCLIKKIEGAGYTKEASVRSESRHSEKLAVAFGIMSLPSWMPIHIMKNLRICGDCHTVIRLVSLVTKRELVVRDANRFHHFKDGHCSCGDFW